jgi:5-(carboxyamino)imidazole ribonucleotide synthase
MVNILGNKQSTGSYAFQGLRNVLSVPGVKLYVYGKKTSKTGRKLGHITAIGRTTKEALTRATKARDRLQLVSEEMVSVGATKGRSE